MRAVRHGYVGACSALLLLAIASGAQTANSAGNSTGIKPSAVSSSAPRRALILFDGTSIKAHDGADDGVFIANLMGHFSFRPTLQPIEDFRPGGMANYDAVFVVIGSNRSVCPEALLRDARARTAVLVWIGFGLDRFLSRGEDRKRGLRVGPVELNSRFRQVKYQGTVLEKGTAMLTPLTVIGPSQVQIAATALDPDGHEVPYIVRRKQLWLVADSPFAYAGPRDRYLAFCDLLHDMLGVNHETSHRAMVRLEDVNPDEDAAQVQRAVDVFIREGVPFQISLVPVFVDPKARRQVALSENPELVAVLHKAVAHGGTIVLHGYTHQYRGMTPSDFEFWDALRNGPRGDDSAQLVRDKLTAALAECFRNDIFPVAWETPHYLASPLDYVEFGKVFSTLNDQTGINAQGAQQFFPYPTVDMRGLQIIPENIGYLPVDNPVPRELVDNARAMMVVRDGIASAFLHDFIDPKFLDDVVRGIRQLGYKYISMRDFACRVSIPDELIATHGAGTDITLRDSYLHQFILDRNGVRRQESWSDVRQTGSVHLQAEPAAGEILIAAGLDERRTAPPGLAARVGRLIAGTVANYRRKNLIAAPPETLSVSVAWNDAAQGEEDNDQTSLANLFRAYGVSPRIVSLPDLRGTNLKKDEVLVVPHAVAAALGNDEVAGIAQWVRAGGRLLLDGPSTLAQATGVAYPGDRAEVGSITDSAEVDSPLNWQPLTAMDRFHVPTGGTILDRDPYAEVPVAASFPWGAGIVLYLGTLFDPYTTDGSSRYPFLFEHALDVFQQVLAVHRRSLEIYFDPGFRQGISIEDLASQWRRVGVRAIYAAAWVFNKSYSYDYERLIRVCHQNGILVYAWFEFPQVSPLFWEQHPEWRDVPAAGNGHPSWRLAMNLANPECRAAALGVMTDVLGRWAWDGANLAELNFDGEGDGDKPESLIPMNDGVRRSFSASYGFDPIDLANRKSRHYWRRDAAGWNHYLAFRTALVTEWHRAFLAALRPFAASGHEVIVTMVDSLEHPYVTPETGIDSMAILKLLHGFPYTLQVEDPTAAWADPPSRYLRLADRYRPLVPPNIPLMFDINVIAERDVSLTHLPLSLLSGVEFAATVHAARRISNRVALYGEAAARSRDLELIAYAAADQATVASHDVTWSVQSPDSIELNVPSEIDSLYLDGKEWPYRGLGVALLPPGNHTLTAPATWLRGPDTSALRPQLLQISASLISAETVRGHLVFEYESPGPVLVGLSRMPAEVFVDGPPARVVPGAREFGAVVILPAGRHRVAITGSQGVAAILDVASLASSSLIVLFGTIATVILMVLFLAIRIRHLFRRRGVSEE